MELKAYQHLLDYMEKNYYYQSLTTSPLHSIFRELDLEDQKIETKATEEIKQKILKEEHIVKSLMEDEEGYVALINLRDKLRSLTQAEDYWAFELDRHIQCKIYDGLRDILRSIESHAKSHMGGPGTYWGWQSAPASAEERRESILLFIEKVRLVEKKFH